MRILLALFNDLPCADCESYGIADIDAAKAARLIKLHKLARQNLLKLDRLNLASGYFSMNLGSILGAFDAFRYNEEMYETLRPKGGITILRDGVKFKAEEDEALQGDVECFRVVVDVNGVNFAAIPKHGDYHLNAASISIACLEQIADGARAEVVSAAV